MRENPEVTGDQDQQGLSPEVREILEQESKEAEVQAAIDAAAEEGISITREEAIRTILEKKKQRETPGNAA